MPAYSLDQLRALAASYATLDRAIVNGKSDSVPLPQRHDLDPTLHPRALLR
jgi:hypothetical protein